MNSKDRSNIQSFDKDVHSCERASHHLDLKVLKENYIPGPGIDFSTKRTEDTSSDKSHSKELD